MYSKLVDLMIALSRNRYWGRFMPLPIDATPGEYAGTINSRFLVVFGASIRSMKGSEKNSSGVKG